MISCMFFFILQMKTFRELFAKVIADKHEDVMAKFGAILAQGIIDAGNVLEWIRRKNSSRFWQPSDNLGYYFFCKNI